ncbi:hypothetical protein JOC77_000147 [Peribacillus deserti]|uniref:Uncharacterized protein n=1 Tax=Peribacillus deserti TaxID=673318 RepID=A0ABS2QC92_9BACI|nr:hypothetical protein [Peribacillus deserti]MBM7690744.1 hypothetical protein [Peribacillus deserti]
MMNPFKKIYEGLFKDDSIEYELGMDLDDVDTETLGIVDHNDPEFYTIRKNGPLK